MSVPKRIAVAAVTVVTASSLASSLLPSPPASSGTAADRDIQSSYVDSEGGRIENDRTLRIVLQDSRNADELASVEDRRAADDVLRSLLDP